MNDLMNESVTQVLVEQPLASPRSANKMLEQVLFKGELFFGASPV